MSTSTKVEPTPEREQFTTVSKHLQFDPAGFAKEVETANERIKDYIYNTPLMHSDYFSEKLGCNLSFKFDHIQHTGSFKARGAISKATTLSDEEKARGFVAASGGNHGLGVCYAAKVFNTHATIFVPNATPQFKIDKIRRMGGEVQIHGNSICEAGYEAMDFAKEKDRSYIHGYRDEDVIRGQGTIALEILEKQPDTDIICVSVGGGGLIAGIAGYVKGKSPSTRVIGSQTRGADGMHESLEAGEIVILPAITSIAESLGIRQVAKNTFEYVKHFVEDVHVVSDDEAMKDVVKILQYEKQLVEPAASCSLSILTTGKVKDFKGKNVVVVLCGSNFPVERLQKYI
ncbi:MAG: threonine/serine dehydratase [Candidatus Peregrinibacteria bacterium]|nr:threonine/serine dehydratase [Candidatus Peregrinibacteria bacterium]